MNLKKLVQEEVSRHLGLVQESLHDSAVQTDKNLYNFFVSFGELVNSWNENNYDLLKNYPLKDSIDEVYDALVDFFSQVSLGEEFLDHFNEFYGRSGLYPNSTGKDFTMKDLREALTWLIRTRPKYEFVGDSMDRELMRDYFINNKRIQFDYDS